MPPLPQVIADHLRAHTTLVMATSNDGLPWIAAVFYAPDFTAAGVTLTCTLLASSRKLANLRVDGHAAILIGPREPTRWLQAEGRAEIIEEEPDRAAAIARLTAHAPAASVFINRVPVVPVVLTLSRIKFTDLTGARPPVVEWTFSPADEV